MATPPHLPHLLPLLLILLVAAEPPIDVNKCCSKTMQWDMEKLTCSSLTWKQNERIVSEVLKPPIDAETADWLPDALRSRVVNAKYDKLAVGDIFTIVNIDNDSVVEEFLSIDARAGVFAGLDELFLPLHSGAPFFFPPLDARAVWKQTYCFDRTLLSPMRNIVISVMSLKKLNKCCQMGERLSADARTCEDTEDDNWLPPTPLTDITGMGYKQVEGGFPFPWNVAVSAAEQDDSRWRLMTPPGNEELTVWVRGSAGRGTREVQGVAWKYCFDAAAPGEFSPLVLLAAVAEVRKCCPRTQRLSANGQQCEHIEGEEECDKEEKEKGVLGEEEVDNSTWMPPTIKQFLNTSDGAATVMYNTNWGLENVHVLDADVKDEWVLQFPDDITPQMYLIGWSRTTYSNVKDWCFDSQEGRGRVLLTSDLCNYASVLCLSKCCPTGGLLGSDGRCRARPATVRDWNPADSAIAPFLPANHTLLPYYENSLPCKDGAFVIHSPDGKKAANLLQNFFEFRLFSLRRHCADFQLSDDGAVREAFAYCQMPPIAGVYVVVRPMQLLAVLFLAVALVAILSDEDTRRSVHGCALACHAACLLLSNSLQTAWFFSHQKEKPCHLFAYSIYFFLVAAGVWLNVVSINMAWGFRQPLGARAAGQRRRPTWRSLALWSIYGWGVPAALTTFAVCMDLNKYQLLEKYTIPSFFETRTCFAEDIDPSDGKGRVSLGTVFYYYVPMAVLVVANGVCLILTTSTIMAIMKETAVLHKMAAGTAANRSLQNARMYVKLLLSAGLTELVVEVAAWATRRGKWTSVEGQNYMEAVQVIYIFHIAATFVDIARALAVLWLAAGSWRCLWLGSWWRRVAALVQGWWCARRRQASVPTDDTTITTTEQYVSTSTTAC